MVRAIWQGPAVNNRGDMENYCFSSFSMQTSWHHTFLVSAMFQPTFSKPLNNSSLISRYFCSCVLFLLSFLLVTSHLSKNWSRVDVQGVPNYFSTSGRLGNDDDDDDDFLIVITTLRLCEPCASATRRTRNGTFFLAPWTSRQELFCTYKEVEALEGRGRGLNFQGRTRTISWEHQGAN